MLEKTFVTPLLRVKFDESDVDIRTSNAAFQQRRVTIVGSKGESDFYLAHGCSHLTNLSVKVNKMYRPP